jgi:hypothetical protein
LLHSAILISYLFSTIVKVALDDQVDGRVGCKKIAGGAGSYSQVSLCMHIFFNEIQCYLHNSVDSSRNVY